MQYKTDNDGNKYIEYKRHKFSSIIAAIIALLVSIALIILVNAIEIKILGIIILISTILGVYYDFFRNIQKIKITKDYVHIFTINKKITYFSRVDHIFVPDIVYIKNRRFISAFTRIGIYKTNSSNELVDVIFSQLFGRSNFLKSLIF